MGSRKKHEGADNVYAAAQLWVDRALRADDSLFTPGVPIWSSRWLGELRKRFLDRPDVGKGSFYEKLRKQLESSPPEVYQLIGEALYVHLLILSPGAMKGNTKLDRIQRVLGWSEQQIPVPEDKFASALSSGMVNMGANRAGYLPFYVGYIIEFAEQWRELGTSERQRLLGDSLEFKRFAAQAKLRGKLFRESNYGHLSQQEALLHLVFPDSFEGIVNVDLKEKIAEAEAFSRFVTEPTDDVDRKIQQIRQGLEADLGRDFDFYDSDIQARWTSSLDAWDEFIGRAKVLVGARIIEIEDEAKYKSEIGKRLAAAREATLKGSTVWPELLRAGLTGPHHPLAWQASDRFRKWLNDASENTQALQDFWAEDSLSIIDRIRRLSSALPREVASRPGLFTNLTSVLLMGLDVGQYPPFKITAFREAYERTGYDMPEQGADEAALYGHALGFLDRLLEEASKRGLPLRDRLDAQTIAYRTIVASLPELPEEEDEPSETPSTSPASELPSLASELHLTVDFFENIETLLAEKKQVIFQGPPGTGKTYVAQKLARHLAGSDERVTLVQFHPSYAYEDFVQGFRPAVLENGQPGFELRDGPLRRAAECAGKEPDAKHFLIIDEINRGQISKVFGELYFLLEYRDSEINLQYSDEPFSLPENLYIIGTMNTADRSIALVDLALRRRFYFVAFHPDDEPVKGVLRRWLTAKGLDGMEWVADVVERANKKMEDDRHAAIGPSYFMKEKLDDASVGRIWQHSVLPYIEERRFGDEDGAGEFDLKALRREVNGTSELEDNATQGNEGGGEQSENGG